MRYIETRVEGRKKDFKMLLISLAGTTFGVCVLGYVLALDNYFFTIAAIACLIVHLNNVRIAWNNYKK